LLIGSPAASPDRACSYRSRAPVASASAWPGHCPRPGCRSLRLIHDSGLTPARAGRLQGCWPR
jgi:hypothetical protein